MKHMHTELWLTVTCLLICHTGRVFWYAFLIGFHQLPLIQVNNLAHWRFWNCGDQCQLSAELSAMMWETCIKSCLDFGKGYSHDLNVKWLNHIWQRNIPGYHPYTDENWKSQSHIFNQNRMDDPDIVLNMHACIQAIQAIEAESWRFFQRGVCVFNGPRHYTHVDHFDHMNIFWTVRCHTLLRCLSHYPAIDSFWEMVEWKWYALLYLLSIKNPKYRLLIGV